VTVYLELLAGIVAFVLISGLLILWLRGAEDLDAWECS